MKNKIVRIVLALVAVVFAFIAFLFVEDSTYDGSLTRKSDSLKMNKLVT
ncbi:MAG: hypothetical protein ACFB2Y_19855 [Fulvivirga sp.]